MAEATETPAPEAPEAPPAEAPPAEAPPSEPASEETPQEAAPPPDISDAMSGLNDIKTRLDRIAPEPEQTDPLGSFVGQPAQEYGYEEQQPYDQGQPQGEPALTEDQRFEQQLREQIREEAMSALRPELQAMQMDRRADGIRAFAKENKGFAEEKTMQAVDAHMRLLDPNFDQPGYVPDPAVVKVAYLAAQAELATSEGAPAPAPDPAQPGATLETGAGPSSPPPDQDPTEQLYHNAIYGDNGNEFKHAPGARPQQ